MFLISSENLSESALEPVAGHRSFVNTLADGDPDPPLVFSIIYIMQGYEFACKLSPLSEDLFEFVLFFQPFSFS